jgi:predicted ferric reductase
MRKKFATRFAAYAFFAANLVAAGWIWWNGSSFYLTHPYPGSIFIAYGRLAGILLQFALLTELVLIARIALLERTFGFMGMNRLHRLVGGWLTTLIVIHPLLLVVGYGGMTPPDAWAQFISFLTDWEEVFIAFVGTMILLVAAFFSIPGIRRRMPYGMWHLLHLGMYVGAVSVFFHQIISGDFAGSPIEAHVYWIVLNVAVLGSVIVYRIGRPIRQFLRHQFVVDQIIGEGGGVTSVVITGQHLDRFRFEPGQHAKLSFLKAHLWSPHPFSFSAAPNGTSLRFSIKALGDFTNRISTLTPGVRVIIDGPLGAFTPSNAETKKFLLIAGGIGITPLFAMLESAGSTDADVVLLYAARNPKSLTFVQEIRRLTAEHPKARAVYFVSEGDDQPTETGVSLQKGFIHEATIRRMVPDAAERDVFVCGPPGMMRVIDTALHAIGIPPHRIHDERFSF